MKQPFFLHMVERLEGLAGKLPASIQKPVLHEITPLKELFLQQRRPRFVLTGSTTLPVQELVPVLFGAAQPEEFRDALMELYHWQKIQIGSHGSIDLLDARGADATAIAQVERELARRPADVFLHLADAGHAAATSEAELKQVATLRHVSSSNTRAAKIVAVSLHDDRRPRSVNNGSETMLALRDALQAVPDIRDHLLHVLDVQLGASDGAARELLAVLARELPHDVRVEIVRISRDRASQLEIAQLLVKSTAAICAAIGAQPIPLADLPVLTTLQLIMVSGIMYVSGRERSVRAATEFVGALGVNVGAGMILREGARAALKFFPGWGNVVCGMVAGAGTYAVGRAATAYFVEGLSLKDARKTYLASRKRGNRRRFLNKSAAELPAAELNDAVEQ